jgi:D-xylose 1-dehydrogenase
MRQDDLNRTDLDEKFADYPSLRDRVVLISGGASGIGEKSVEAFARKNARVVFLDVQDDAAERVVRGIQASGFSPPTYLHCDVTDVDALRQCAEEAAESFGTIDVLVNNAGNDTRHTLEEVTPEYWDQAIAVNLKH